MYLLMNTNVLIQLFILNRINEYTFYVLTDILRDRDQRYS